MARKPLKKYPVLFYLLAVALSIVYLVTALWSVPPMVRSVIFVLMQKCTLALAFFTVVMFIGVFDKDSAIGQGLRPVRAELSIVACILTIGHMVVYLIPFAPRVFGGYADAWVMVFFVTAIALLVLLLILGVTSVQKVKRAMHASTWKKVQRWAYVFFGLVYIHLMVILLPPALNGGAAAKVSVAVYTVLFAAYAVLRVRRAVADSKKAGGEARAIEA
ncbi:MAG: ferric reductase-like transmembrane domain-containing protein [Eggerthellaceae bacterium]|nr:ferric reductase-like transmembrane domain-containing protein [Eggerthellaceae bacterium]